MSGRYGIRTIWPRDIGPVDVGAEQYGLPPLPTIPQDGGAPMAGGTFDPEQQNAPDGFAQGWWTWARKLLSGVVSKSLQLPLPEIAAIPGSTFFQPFDFQQTIAVGQVALPGTLLKLQPGQMARIDSINIFMGGIGAGSLTPTNFATFALRFDQSPVPGLSKLATFPRSAVSIQDPLFPNLLVRVPSGVQQVDIVATNTDGGSYIVGAYYTGWQWNTEAGKRWREGHSTLQT